MGEGPTAYFIPGRVGWGVGPRQIRVCRLSSVCLSVCRLSVPPPRPTRDPPQQMGRSMDRSRIDPGSIQDFIIFYMILLNFTLKSIKYTFWPGFLPLQGTPTGKNNGFLSYVTLFDREIYKIHIWARNFAPARNTDRQK